MRLHMWFVGFFVVGNSLFSSNLWLTFIGLMLMGPLVAASVASLLDSEDDKPVLDPVVKAKADFIFGPPLPPLPPEMDWEKLERKIELMLGDDPWRPLDTQHFIDHPNLIEQVDQEECPHISIEHIHTDSVTSGVMKVCIDCGASGEFLRLALENRPKRPEPDKLLSQEARKKKQLKQLKHPRYKQIQKGMRKGILDTFRVPSHHHHLSGGRIGTSDHGPPAAVDVSSNLTRWITGMTESHGIWQINLRNSSYRTPAVQKQLYDTFAAMSTEELRALAGQLGNDLNGGKTIALPSPVGAERIDADDWVASTGKCNLCDGRGCPKCEYPA